MARKKRKTSSKQRAGLQKGHALMKEAKKIYNAAGKKTVPAKKVGKITMSKALKQASNKHRARKAYR